MKIFLVFKTHFDIGFTDLARNVISQYQTKMLPDVIDTCRQTSALGDLKYVWTMPSWPLTVMQKSREHRGDLDDLIQRGQIAWHALPYTFHIDFSGPEDIIHSLHYAAELSEAYKKPLPISAKMTDVPGHGRILPTILAGAGIRFLHLGCNAFATPPDVPLLFFWEGVDGSRVLTMYCAGGYGSQLLPPEGWPFPVWMALMHTHDNCGPQSAEMIRAMADEIHQTCPEAEVVCGTMDDFYHALESCDLSGLPVIRQDLSDTWIHGAGTYPAEVREVRQARRDLLAADAASFLTGADPDRHREAADQAYDALAIFDEHTWGMDVKTFMNPDRVYRKDLFQKFLRTEEARRMESSWEEQRQRAAEASGAAQRALRLSCAGGSEPAVLNPNGCAFSGWADAPDDAPGAVAFPDGHKVYVEDLPPFCVSPLHGRRMPAADGSLENRRYRLRIDRQRGVITEVYDKVLNCALLRERYGVGVFSYHYDVYGITEGTEYIRSFAYRFFDWGIRDNLKDQYPEISHQACQPKFLGMEQQGCTVILNYSGSGCAPYGDADRIRIEVTLPPMGDELFLQIVLQGKQETPYTESGRIAFPLADDAPAFFLNKNGDFLNPATEIASQANHALYCIEDFLCAQGDSHGLCLLSRDAPLFSIGEPGIYAYRKQYEPHAPILYCGLFNNMCGTNFPQWIGGDFSYRFLLFGYAGAADSRVYTRALSLAQGARVLPAPCSDSPLQLPEGVQVLRLYREKGAWILHLRDTKWVSRPITVRYNGKRITPIDLRGVPIGLTAADEAQQTMNPFGILAFRIE